jgi:hypothetical protein
LLASSPWFYGDEMVTVVVVLVVVVFAVAVVAEIRKQSRMDPEERAAYTAQIRAQRGTRTQRISEVGTQVPGGLACPKCGGTQFKARRSNTKRVTLAATAAIATPLTRQTQVQCVTCGTKFKRG